MKKGNFRQKRFTNQVVDNFSSKRWKGYADIGGVKPIKGGWLAWRGTVPPNGKSLFKNNIALPVSIPELNKHPYYHKISTKFYGPHYVHDIPEYDNYLSTSPSQPTSYNQSIQV